MPPLQLAYFTGSKYIIVDQTVRVCLGGYISLLIAYTVPSCPKDKHTGMKTLCGHQLHFSMFNELCKCNIQQ